MNERGRRAVRLADLIREEVGNLLVHEVKDPRIGFATVTGVRLSGDLRAAIVSVSVLGDAEQKEESLKGLTAAQGFLRRQLAQRLGLRYAPAVTFQLDRTEETEQQMQLDGSLGAAVLGPVEDAGAEFDQGGVQAQQLVLKAESMPSGDRAAAAEQLIKHALVQLPGAVLVGVGQGRALGRVGLAAPLAALLGHVQQRVEHLQIADTDIAALARQARCDTKVLCFGDLHTPQHTTHFLISVNTP